MLKTHHFFRYLYVGFRGGRQIWFHFSLLDQTSPGREIPSDDIQGSSHSSAAPGYLSVHHKELKEVEDIFVPPSFFQVGFMFMIFGLHAVGVFSQKVCVLSSVCVCVCVES